MSTPMHSSGFTKALETAGVFSHFWETRSPAWRWLLVGPLVERGLLGGSPAPRWGYLVTALLLPNTQNALNSGPHLAPKDLDKG